MLAREKTANALHSSSPTGAEIITVMFSTKVADACPPLRNNTAPGVMNELMMIAGKVESMPAMSIASPCCRVVERWNLDEEKLHQAKTGVENPTNHAGMATNRARRMNPIFDESIRRGANAIEEIITPPRKSIHKCFATGTRSGYLERTMNCRMVVGTGVCKIFEFGKE